MRIDTQALVDWLRAKAAEDLAIERVIEAKLARKQAEDALGEAEERLLIALDTGPAVVGIDLSGSALVVREPARTLMVYLDGRMEVQP